MVASGRKREGKHSGRGPGLTGGWAARTGLLVLPLLIAPCTAAGAEVLEIGAGGAVTVRTGAANGAAADVADPADGAVPTAALTQVDAGTDVPAAYAAAVRRIASETRLSPRLIEAVVWQESRWHAQAVSRAGAIGLAQLMPATARALGVNPADPIANLEAGARYLRILLDHFDGDVEKALAAYNAGAARVERAGGVPMIAETRGYVAAISARLSSSVRRDQ